MTTITYRIRVQGYLSSELKWFPEMDLTSEPDGSTVLCGPVADQAALHGLLVRIRDLGLVLLSVEKGEQGHEEPPRAVQAGTPAEKRGQGGYDAVLVERLLLAPGRVQRYPRSSRYDPRWIYENERGSHCLWLMEALGEAMALQPGMRVLELGCGKAIDGIFLAKEWGVQLWAVDFDVSPTENWARIVAAGVQDRVIPLRADARNLPFADGFFDAVVGINSLQFFGTDDQYLPARLIRTIRPGGQIGMIVPGLLREFDGEIPGYIAPYWDPTFFSWHSPSWWRRHWGQTGLVDVRVTDTLDDGEGYTVFKTWEQVMKSEHRLVAVDGGRNVTFVRLVAQRKE